MTLTDTAGLQPSIVADALPRDPRARLAALFDPGTLTAIAGDGTGVLAAAGRIGPLSAVAFATDPAVQGGALGVAGCEVITAAYEHAVTLGVPVIGIWHSGGARLAEGVASLHGVGSIFAAMTAASGAIPQITVVIGPAAGGAAYGAALTDLVIQSGNGKIFVTGPDVIRSVTGEEVTMAELGGTEVHSRRSGVAHVVTSTDAEAFERARELAVLLACRHDGEGSQQPGPAPELSGLLPESARRAYDVRPLATAMLDGPGVELQPHWARNVVTVLGRLAGRTTGVVATNPLRLGGCLDAAGAEKAARFVRMCSAFGVPLVVLVDVPGYLPGLSQEWDGIVRRGAKLLHAFAEAAVPRVTLITRKAYGGAYIAMNSRALGATKVFAWPGAEVDVMGALPAIRILHRRRLAALPPDEVAQAEAEFAAEHERTTGGLGRAVELGVIDEIIAPEDSRRMLAAAIASAPARRGEHRNIPL
jgi:acetyl-CoA/propionyl-CoA carboxylase carboxyl transferase subunit